MFPLVLRVMLAAAAVTVTGVVADASAATPTVAWTVAATGGLAAKSALSYGNPSMAMDANGNLYVTGSSYNGVTNDLLTVKYDTTGSAVWRALGNGATNSEDVGSGIAIDAAGNTYVAGQSLNGSRFDSLLIKYDPNGVELWRSANDFSETGDDDGPTAIAVDGVGGIVTTGVVGNGDVQQCLTVRYAESGAVLWRARTACVGETPLAVAASGDGAYVLTEHYRLAYDLAGTERWRVLDTAFIAAALSREPQGGVVVTGTARVGNGLVSNFVTVEYAASGVERWRVTDEGNSSQANAIAVDSAGNVIVSGGSNGAYVTIKYGPDGIVKWKSRGPNAQSEASLAVDAAGNVYQAGLTRTNTPFDYVTTKFDANGVEQWRNSVPGAEAIMAAPALAIDGLGNVFVAGSRSDGVGQYHFLTIKYSAAGVGQWLVNEGQTEAAATIGAFSKSMALDRDNNIYVTGSRLQQLVTIKFSAGGAERWRVVEPDLGDGSLVTVDAQGNVYVAAAGRTGYVTIKYDAAGQRLWRQVDGGSGSGFASPRALVVDGDGSVFVTGESFNGIRFFATVKYDANGVQRWRAIGNPVPTEPATGHALSLTGDGGVIAAGVRYNGTDSEFVTIRYSASGAVTWRTLAPGAINGFDFNSDVVADASGNVYLSGASYLGPDWKFTTIAYDAGGAERWRTESAGASGRAAVRLDASGNVYALRSDYSVVKHDPLGNVVWITAGSGGFATDNIPTAFVVLPDGSSYGTGAHWNGHDYDYLTIKLGPDGAEQWRVTHNNLLAQDFAANVAVSSDGSILVSGNSNLGYGPPAIVLQKITEEGLRRTVVEFFNPDLDHYFITGDPVEQASVDAGAVGNWQRTGGRFVAAGLSAVCRFYGNAATDPSTGAIFGPNSHFYTVNADECEALKHRYAGNEKSWRFESYDFLTSPVVFGACAAGQVPVYRAYNNGFARGIDSNHRITTDPAAIAEVVARGWVYEGIVMCALAPAS
jgi:hypothetical protein